MVMPLGADFTLVSRLLHIGDRGWRKMEDRKTRTWKNNGCKMQDWLWGINWLKEMETAGHFLPSDFSPNVVWHFPVLHFQRIRWYAGGIGPKLAPVIAAHALWWSDQPQLPRTKDSDRLPDGCRKRARYRSQAGGRTRHGGRRTQYTHLQQVLESIVVHRQRIIASDKPLWLACIWLTLTVIISYSSAISSSSRANNLLSCIEILWNRWAAWNNVEQPHHGQTLASIADLSGQRRRP